MPIRAFLSYSHKNRKLARRLKEGLAEFGIEAFLAHDDIGVSERWRRVILRKLRDCEIFIPILTDAFVESEWTDQEAGYALGRGKRVVPLRVDVGPYGFIGAFQALRLNQKTPTETCWMVMESLKDHDTLGQKVREDVIGVFLQSSTFEEASKNLTKLTKFRPFSPDQLAKIIKGSSRNQNIYGCHRAQPRIEGLLEEARAKVPKGTIARYRKAVKSWPY
jgi:hypothetical protein